MKYLLEVLLVILISIFSSLLIFHIINHLKPVFKNRIQSFFFVLGISFIFLILALVFYVSDYNRATNYAKEYLITNDEVKVEKTEYGYFFDGKGNDEAIIFYPGGKV